MNPMRFPARSCSLCLLSLLLLSGCPSPATTPAVTPAAAPRPVTVPTRVDAGLDLSQVTLPETVERKEGFVQLDFAQAAKLSQVEGKPLFIYFYTVWCGPCKELDKKVFVTPEFQAYAASIVSVAVDAGEDSLAPIAERYDVHSYPTMVVCKPGGEEIERFFGFSETPVFVATIQDYIAGRNTATDYRDRALAAPEDLELAYAAGRELAIRKRGNEAIPFLERVWRADKENATGQVPRAMLLLAKTVYLDTLHAREKALPILEELSERFPGTYHGMEATYMIARAYLEMKQREKAEEVLRTRVTIAPHDPMQYFRYGTFCMRYSVLQEEGKRVLAEGIEQHPKAGFLWKALADLRFRTKDYAGAVEAMEQALALPGASKKAYEKLLETYRKALERAQEEK